MISIEYIQKLMSWCPIKNSLQKESNKDCFSSFELENERQPVPSLTDLQEGKVLKAQVSLSRDIGVIKIILPALVITIILGVYFGNNALDVLFFFIPYLALLALILYNRMTVELTPEKVIIRRHLFKSLVLRKEDIMQVSVSKNKNHLLRWPLRLLVLVALAVQLPRTVENLTRYLQMEATPVSVKLSSVLVGFWMGAYILVIYYIFELLAPYQQTLKITARSNLNLEFYTEMPGELIAVLRNEKG